MSINVPSNDYIGPVGAEKYHHSTTSTSRLVGVDLTGSNGKLLLDERSEILLEMRRKSKPQFVLYCAWPVLVSAKDCQICKCLEGILTDKLFVG